MNRPGSHVSTRMAGESEPLGSRRGLGDMQREAFERFAQEMRALPPGRLRPLNVHPYAAAQTVIQAAARYTGLRTRMATMGPELDLALIDKCAALAHAYCYASQKYVMLRNGSSLAELRREALALRSRLRSRLELLTGDGRLRLFQLSPLRNTVSYASVSYDLTALVRFFSENWDEFAPPLGISREDLARGDQLAVHLLASNTLRDERAQAVREFALLAHQAFTLFCEAYDEVRRAVIFLRSREGDAEEVAPSLYGKGKRRRAAKRGVPPAAEPEAQQADASKATSAAPLDLRQQVTGPDAVAVSAPFDARLRLSGTASI